MNIISVRNNLRIYFALCLLYLLCSFSFWASNEEEYNVDVGIKLVNPSKLIQLNTDLSLYQVEKLLGTKGKYQFSVEFNGDEYLLSYIWVGKDSDPRENGIVFSLLFKNRKLYKITRPPQFEVEIYPYKNTVASRIKPWNVNDIKRIKKALTQKNLSVQERKDELKILDTIDKYRGDHKQIPDFIINKYLKENMEEYYSKIRQDYRRNKKLLDKYNGFLIQLGMTTDSIDEIFGDPMLVQISDKGEIVKIYGTDLQLAVAPIYKYSCVAVVFMNGVAIRIFSNSWFYDGWKIGKNIFDVKDVGCQN